MSRDTVAASVETEREAEHLLRYYKWHAHFYDLTRWAFLFGRSRLIRDAARRISPRRILEIGCGTGRNLAQLAEFFPSAQIVGVDLSAEMLGKARKKIAPHGSRISLFQCEYKEPMAEDNPFDLILISYCLTMINPGFDEVLSICMKDLSHDGHMAVVDFHDTKFGWFRDWMGVNHVRMEGQVLGSMDRLGLRMKRCEIKSAYGGLWRWFECLGSAR